MRRGTRGTGAPDGGLFVTERTTPHRRRDQLGRETPPRSDRVNASSPRSGERGTRASLWGTMSVAEPDAPYAREILRDLVERDHLEATIVAVN